MPGHKRRLLRNSEHDHGPNFVTLRISVRLVDEIFFAVIVDLAPCRREGRNLVLEPDLVQQAACPSRDQGLVIEDLEQALPDLTRFLAGINGFPDARLLIVCNDWAGLSVVSRETLLKCLRVIVGALDKRFSGNIVGHGGLGRAEDLVV